MTEDDLIELIIKAEFNYNDKILKTYPETAVAVLRRMLQVNLRVCGHVLRDFKPDPAQRIQAGELHNCAWVNDREVDPPTALDIMKQMLQEQQNGSDE